ncbi:MAG: NADH-quinone oxidoreductase subunit J [Actinomycetota bacterium]|nr:NADH-quinone oxidoreductase subunit J [Actinomycetota bacterium]
MLAQNVIFYAVAAVMAVAAIRVVTTKNVVHAALYLVIVLAGVAGQYILLAAEFTAVVQVLVYIGAIVVLFLFGIMLTRAPIGRSDNLDNDQRFLALTVSVFVLTMLGSILWDAFGDTKIEGNRVQTSAEVGLSIFRDYVIPFEVISVLLLAALVGAVVIARRD